MRKISIFILQLFLTVPLYSQSFSIDENGIVKCEGVEIGSTGIINDVEYEAVDRQLLIQRRDQGADLTKVCTSNVTDMSDMFMGTWENPSEFNEPIGNWDVSSVTDMSNMFSSNDEFSLHPFNQDISNWNVSNVTSMSGMFRYSDFNQPIGDWDVSQVIDMSWMFTESAFNQEIGNWDVSSVTNMRGMFTNSWGDKNPFNQQIGNWNVGNVIDMSSMFYGSSFNQPIGGWNVSKVKNMQNMFGESLFDKPVENWDVSNVSNMNSMFRGSEFNQSISYWDVSKVNDMRTMFGLSLFNQPLNQWCVIGIPNEPENFSVGGQLSHENKPLWGTCPIPTGTPTKIVLIGPSDGQTSVSINSIFEWQQDSLSTKYQIQLFEGYATSKIDSIISNNNFTLSANLNDNLQYFWRVRGINENVIVRNEPLKGEWSLLWSFSTGEDSNSTSFSIDENGIVMCNGALPGRIESIDGTEYESVDRDLLIQRNNQGADLSKLCVSNVTDMSELFMGIQQNRNNFNQPIGNRDVSNVINMRAMFSYSQFNQPIGNWDVGSVIDMSKMFEGNYAFDQDISDWNVSNVTDMSAMFKITEFYENINFVNWDVSSVTDMSSMFERSSTWGQEMGISNWDVSSVENMSRMFYRANEFNEPIFNWDVSSVKDMSRMFEDCYLFNQPIGSWDVSSVTNMSGMFEHTRFNQPIGDWDVSNVTDMSYMFRASGDSEFNQPIGNWDVSSVTNMRWMFFFADKFNQPIDNWDVSNVTDMSNMFQYTTFNQPIGNWNVGNVINMHAMFAISEFNQDLNNWNVSTVENMSAIFSTSQYNQPLGNWDVSNVKNMGGMFSNSPFNQPIANWDVSNVSYMHNLFSNSPFNQPIANWDVSNVESMSGMFFESAFNQPLNSWDVSNVTHMGEIFSGSQFNQPIDNWDVSSVSIMYKMFDNSEFNHSIGIWDVSNVRDMRNMFNGTPFNQPINQWCTPKFSSEPDKFSTDSPLSEENKPVWGTCPIRFLPPEGTYQVDNLEVRLNPKNNVYYTLNGSLPNTGSNLYSEPFSITSTTTIKAAYIDENTSTADIYEALYTIDIPTFSLAENNLTILCDDAAIGDTWEFQGTIYTKRSKEQITPANASTTCTSGIVSMDSLFSKLPDFNEDISHWDVSDVIDMSYMFDGASTFNQDISAWDVSYVTNTENMFRDAYQFNQPIGEWFLINVTTIAGMFHNATSINQPLDNWDVSNVYHAHYLFTNATSFDQSLALWNLSSLGNTNAMFDGAGLSIENYDASVAGWASHGNVSENIILSVGGLVYCNTVGRNHLINEYGWNFIGDSRSDVCYDVEMTVSDNYPNSINITFGTLINSTNDFDVETDRLAPPAPPSGSFDARLRTNNQDYFTFYHPPTEDNNDWTLLFTPETGFAPITLSWEIEDLPANGQLLLTDMIDGSFLNVDMSEQSSVTIEQEFITQVTITHQLPVSVTETYRANWDLVGLSVELEHNDYSELFPSANPNTLYGYDGTYNEAQNLLSGRGYWLNFSEQSNLTFSGFPISELNLELRANWNLIAGLTEETIIIDENGILLPGSLYGYDGTYTEASSLTPGNGYWLAAINEGTISLIATNDNTLLSIENDGQNSEDNRNSNHSKSNRSYQLNPRLDVKMLSEAGQIHFSQRGVDLPALYIDADISETYHPLQLSLPPLAPSGAVDARLDNNRWITEEKEAKIRLQQNDEPLFLTITDNTNHFEVAFLNGTNVINKIYTNDEQNILVPTTADFVLISLYHESKDENVPLNYLLQQNYPNPFNPKTSIRYALPEASDVHLEVYNMSGQLITTLVKTSQQAGIYEVNFDASSLSSGVYFYRLVANEFSQVKRMVLMK